jgi:hypothetical protein
METKFNILVHRNDENIHLKLAGDFDGYAAHELLNTLKSCCHGFSRAFIHTNCLNQIHPSGRYILQSNLHGLDGKRIPLVFTGDNAGQLAPEGSRLL